MKANRRQRGVTGRKFEKQEVDDLCCHWRRVCLNSSKGPPALCSLGAGRAPVQLISLCCMAKGQSVHAHILHAHVILTEVNPNSTWANDGKLNSRSWRT